MVTQTTSLSLLIFLSFLLILRALVEAQPEASAEIHSSTYDEVSDEEWLPNRNLPPMRIFTLPPARSPTDSGMYDK